MKFLIATILIICFLFLAAGIIIQYEEKQQQIAERKRIEKQQQLAAERHQQELKKCEEVLNWFREQEYCTVKPFGYGDGKTVGYNISWKIRIKEQPIVTRSGSTTTVQRGSAAGVNGGGTWLARSGTYAELVKIKRQFEKAKSIFGLN